MALQTRHLGSAGDGALDVSFVYDDVTNLLVSATTILGLGTADLVFNGGVTRFTIPQGTNTRDLTGLSIPKSQSGTGFRWGA